MMWSLAHILAADNQGQGSPSEFRSWAYLGRPVLVIGLYRDVK